MSGEANCQPPALPFHSALLVLLHSQIDFSYQTRESILHLRSARIFLPLSSKCVQHNQVSRSSLYWCYKPAHVEIFSVSRMQDFFWRPLTS